jgi:hypothetical protein
MRLIKSRELIEINDLNVLDYLPKRCPLKDYITLAHNPIIFSRSSEMI